MSIEHLTGVYMLDPAIFGGNVSGAEHYEANDPEPEIWRACQRSIAAVDGRSTASAT